MTNLIKAQSPAGFAEEYIVESIWNGKFAPGSILPAERELSELIGVTRTTLREVLQRLVRDGWLTIQHGKPTKVNNFWETSGLNILETLARLEQQRVEKDEDNSKYEGTPVPLMGKPRANSPYKLIIRASVETKILVVTRRSTRGSQCRRGLSGYVD